jgi:hypothetical protein
MRKSSKYSYLALSGFAYPEPCTDVSVWEYAGDFLRDPLTAGQRCDPRYLLNQRVAANYFLDWIRGRGGHLTFEQFLRAQHRIASLGLEGNRPYRIPVDYDAWLEPELRSNVVFYHAPLGSSQFRETFPGVFRSELEIRAIQHPATDILSVSRSDHEWLSACCASSPINALSWRDGKLAQDGGLPSNVALGIRFSLQLPGAPPPITLQISLRADGTLQRRAPVGDLRTLLFRRCEYLADLLKREFSNSTVGRSRFILVALLYYHSCINLMPFSNINNSLFMGHLNACLRCAGQEGLAHANWDTFAMITAPRDFAALVLRRYRWS